MCSYTCAVVAAGSQAAFTPTDTPPPAAPRWWRWRTSTGARPLNSQPAGREPVVYLRRAGDGRVCYLQLGHDMRAWDEPPVREILGRCARWACGQTTGVAA
ncbi:MAG TPA: hypothetical protein VF933_36200 [Streptosporangiaceae bacterium]